MKFTITNPRIVYSGFLKILEVDIEYDSFKGGERIRAKREMMDRGDSVAVLLFERDTLSILLTHQFRYLAADKDLALGIENAGWLLELPAGGLHEGEDPIEAAKREVHEELGYELADLKHISSLYVSPGGTSERVHVYYSEVNSSDKKSEGGGLSSEKEDIRLVRLSIEKMKESLADGRIRDAKTILSLQWFLMTLS
jgi:nudix-type nucleoside diphosphatase (YffH/AdpP family)